MNKRPEMPSTIPHLPHELILDIFSRFPAQALKRFKYISKPLYNSIADPSFIKLHLKRAMEQGTSNLLLSTKPIFTGTSPFLVSQLYSIEGDSFTTSVQIGNPLNFKSDFGFMALGSCNGVVGFANGNIVCLLNPFTREYKIVEFQTDLGLGLNQMAYGLGYDENNEDYILVQFVLSTYYNHFESQVRVYSLSDTPRSKICNIPYGLHRGHRMGVYLHGCLHWAVQRKYLSPLAIIAFHNTEKVVKEIPLPNALTNLDFTLGTLGGNICILCSFFVADCELWVMKRYGVLDSWLKLFSIGKEYLSMNLRTSALCFFEKDKVLLMDKDKHILYQPRPKAVWNINYLNISWPRIDRSITYVATLVPLNSGTYVAVC